LKFVRKYIEEEIPTLDPVKYCLNFADKLQLSVEIINAANELVNKIQAMGLMDGKNPRTIAAVAIFYVTQLQAGNKIGLKEIAYVSNIKDNTIKSAYGLLFAYRYQIIPEWQDRLPIKILAIMN